MNFNHKRAIGRFHLLTAKASLAFLSALLPIACTWPDWKKEYPPVAAPHTRVEAVRETIHGVELTDPYRWLEDQQSPETRAWIDAQNDYTRKMLASFKGREAIKKRLGELMKIDTMSAPIARGGRYFFSRKLADQDLWVIVMREGLDGKDQVLVDPHPMSPDHSTSVGIMDISDDGKLLAYFVREGGKDETAVRFLDVDSRRELTDALPPARYFGLSLAPDKSGFYYSRHGEEGSRIYYHKMGGEPASDRKIFGDGYGPEKLVYAFLSENGRHLVITVHHGSAAKKTEVYSKNAALDGPIIPIVNDLDARFEPQVGGDTLY
ncbi:hypothetical protein HY256_04445, partial [Candidatus Sumerlaeota bacterium]|nr:hypothetical protein [Candidatus Sumerlaeota bacterium]